MARFDSLPGVFVTKLDGNLRPIAAVPEDVVAVVGTSPGGPTGVFFLVTDTVEASKTYDPDGTGEGTLLRAMNEVLEGGAPLVALYRIGAKPSILDFIGPFKIESVYGGEGGLEDFSYFYDHSENRLQITLTSTSQIVYDNDTAAPVDTGALKVSETHPELSASTDIDDIGVLATPLTWTALLTYLETSGLSGTDAVGGTLTQATNEIVIPIASAPETLVEGSMIKFTDAGVSANNGTYEVIAMKTVSTDYVYSVREVDTAYSQSPRLVIADLPVFADDAASDDVFTDGVILGHINYGINGTTLDYKERYEELQDAYWNLESAQIDGIYPAGAYHDAPNVITNAGSFSAPSVTDFLGEAYYEIFDGQMVFMWDDDNDDSADVLTAPYYFGLTGADAQTYYDNLDQGPTEVRAGGADTVTFHEVNFSHQLATYLYYLAEDDNEAIGAIGVMPPVDMTKRGISQWVGQLPVYDAASGNITADGTGLLGNRFMAGTTAKAAGLIKTDSDYVDGTWQKDDNGSNIEIGKYLVVVPDWVNMVGVSGSSNYIGTASGLYCGFVESLAGNVAPTNKELNASITLPFRLKKSELDALTGLHYTMLGFKPNGNLKIVDAPTAATENSDWRRLSTVRAVADIIESIRAIADPYIGNLFSSATRGALQDQIDGALVSFQQSGYLESGSAQLTQTRNQVIAGEATLKLTLYVPGELRRLYVTVALTA